jgi:putative ABC transport system permease protein
VFILFAALSIIVACMGLFGLVSFITVQRSKEISIRKVLGASISAITFLLSKDFTKLVLFAFIIAVPASWFFMDRWLQGFAYHIDIPWWSFALSGFLTVLIAALTIAFQCIKAALANPIENIKTE